MLSSKSICFLFLVTIGFVCSVPIGRHGWKFDRNAHDSEPVVLYFALKQQNLNVLEATTLDVSNPHSKNYGKHLSFEEVNELVAPSKSTKSAISKFLEKHNVPLSRYSKKVQHINEFGAHFSHSGDFIVARVNVKVATKILRTPLYSFVHEDTNERIIRSTKNRVVPAELENVVDFIGGVINFPRRVHYRNKVVDPVPQDNSPYIARVFVGDNNFAAFFLVRCEDGSYSTNAQNPCAQGANPGVDGFQYKITQHGKTRETFTDYSEATCDKCENFDGSQFSLCSSLNKNLNLPQTAVYCQTSLIEGYANYLPIDFSLTTVYKSPSLSITYKYPKHLYLGEFVTPSILRSRYEVDPSVHATSPKNSQSVAEFLGQYYAKSDLTAFFNYMGVKPTKVVDVGPNNETLPGGEASLDIQYIMGVAPNVNTTFWSLGGLHDGQEPFLTWITDVLNSPEPPLVHSISYGDDEPTLDPQYMTRVSNEFMEAGSKGITLLFSSGDNGVNHADPSITKDCVESNHFTPSFPATSPWVTAVGGTQFSTQTYPICAQTPLGLPASCHVVGEITSSVATGSRITSGGGFSDVFPMPAYQKEVATKYVAEHLVNEIPIAFYNATGRAYPDISACARNYLTVIGGSLSPVDGTSASAPTTAAIIALLNDARLNNNKKPLGFLNVMLYKLGKSPEGTYFNDVIMGDNSCGENVNSCCPFGYPATIGWDATTGFGTPRFNKLRDVVLFDN